MMRRGLPKSIIKKYGITKKAWSVFRGKKRRPRKSRSSNPSRRRRRYLPRRRRRRGGKSLTQTAFKFVRIGALVAPGVNQYLTWKGTGHEVTQILLRYTGYNMEAGKFEPQYLVEGYGPYAVASLITYGIPKLMGIIRRL